MLKRNFLHVGELSAFRNMPATAPNTPGPGANHSSLLAPARKQWGLQGVPGLSCGIAALCSNAGQAIGLQTRLLPVHSHEIWMAMTAHLDGGEMEMRAPRGPSLRNVS